MTKVYVAPGSKDLDGTAGAAGVKKPAKGGVLAEKEAAELLKMNGSCGDVFDDIGRVGKAKERLITAAQIYTIGSDSLNADRCMKEARDLDSTLLKLVENAAVYLRKEIEARRERG